MYKVLLHKQAVKDLDKLKAAGLSAKARQLTDVLSRNPFEPPCEKLVGNLAGAYSRRINIQHRMIYTVSEEERTVKILRMWTHYE